MFKIQFGSGENKLEGWQNLQEQDADITEPLKFFTESVDYILAEHVVEHVTPQEAFDFFCECHRVLKPNGIARIIVPDVSKILHLADQDYFDFIRQGSPRWWKEAGYKWEDKPVDLRQAMRTIIFCHGHKGCWNVDTLKDVLAAVGFRVDISEYGKSECPELNGVDGHWKMMGLERCKMESSVVEACK